MMTEQHRARRNLNPHREARLAMLVWHNEYAAQGGGSMDFWDSLRAGQKRDVREWLDELERTPRAERMSRMEPMDGPKKLSVVCNICGKPWNDGHGSVFCEAAIRSMVEEVRANAMAVPFDVTPDYAYGVRASLDALLARLEG